MLSTYSRVIHVLLVSTIKENIVLVSILTISLRIYIITIEIVEDRWTKTDI